MKRLAIAVCCYTAIFCASFFVALQLRFDLGLRELSGSIVRDIAISSGHLTTPFQIEQLAFAKDVFRHNILFVLILKLLIVTSSRDWLRRLRYSTPHDMAWSATMCLLCGLSISMVQPVVSLIPQIPRSVIIIDTIISAGAVVAARMLAQTLRMARVPGRANHITRCLIYADGAEAASLVTSIRGESSRLKVVGIVSPGEHAHNGVVAGTRVFNASLGLRDIIARTGAEMLLLSSRLTGRVIRQACEDSRLLGVETHLVPAVDEIPSGRFRLQMRDITIDDLLRREPNQLDLHGIRAIVQDRVILVTGAAGSIGSEVCRQLLHFSPRRIVLLDQSEFGIFRMEQELRAGWTGGDTPEIQFVIEDITDQYAMTRLMMAHRPNIIFHAAAYKHVPLMESNPQAAVRNNIFGTRVLVDLASRFLVERFVLISTDKAVRPTNVMGATKLIAEQYLQCVASESKTRFITVRFGNVLNSAGSVVPTFRQQIEAGGPVTVTDPEMQRYFMTIPEAVQLVLQASAVGEGGDVLILDMGEPIRILDLARDMIRLSGLEYPRDIDIVFTGLRPGEKLFEELFYETEQNACRVHEKILRAPRQLSQDPAVIRREIQRLDDHLNAGRNELKDVLWKVTASFVAQSSAVDDPLSTRSSSAGPDSDAVGTPSVFSPRIRDAA